MVHSGDDESDDGTKPTSVGGTSRGEAAAGMGSAREDSSGRVRGAPAALGKSKAKAKKQARKAGQNGGAESDELRCSVCGRKCDSRNQLFKHLKDSGHAVAPR